MNIFDRKQQEETLLGFKDTVTIKQIVLYNSARYGYFESDFSQHLLFEGHNNTGKTSLLNVIQLLVLPEVNLKKLNQNFAIKSGAENKVYTSAGTYNYYFPDENSYAVIEIENDITTFCVLLYGYKTIETEYRRIILETDYQSIRHMFFDSQTQSQVLSSKKDLFDRLKHFLHHENKHPFTEISKKDDIINQFYSLKIGGKPNKFNIVPLASVEPTQVESFSLLFRSLYSVSHFTMEKQIKLISGLIANKLHEQKKLINFDFKKMKEDFQSEKERRSILTLLESKKDDFDFLEINNIKNIKLKRDLKDRAAYISIITSNFLNSKDKNVQIARSKLTESESKRKDYEDLSSISNKEKDDLADELRDAKKQLKEIESQSDFISLDFFKDEFKTSETLQLIADRQEELLSFYESQEKEHKQLREDLFNKRIEIEEYLSENKDKALSIQRHKRDRDDYVQKINQLKKSFSAKGLTKEDIFSDEEKVKLEILFKDGLLKNNISDLSEDTINKIKDFLSSFSLNNNTLSIDYIDITYILQEIKSKTTIEKEIKEFESKLATVNEHIALLESEIKDIDLLNIDARIANIKKEMDKLEPIIYFIKRIASNQKDYSTLTSSSIEKEKELNNTIITIENIRTNIQLCRKEEDSLKVEIEKLKTESRYYEQADLYLKNPLDIDDFFGKSIEELINEFDEATYKKESSQDIQENLDSLKRDISLWRKIDAELNMKLSAFTRTTIFDEKFTSAFIQEQSNFKELLRYLSQRYNSLNQDIEANNRDIENRSSDMRNSIQIIDVMKSHISSMEKSINKIFADITISDLGEVRFKITIDEVLERILKRIKEKIDKEDDNWSDNFKELSEYMEKHLSDNNEIKIEDIIKSIKYEIYKDGELIPEGQSNGTETMINLLFIIKLLAPFYKDGFNFNCIIPLDEMSKVDPKNMKSLLDEVKKEKYVMIAASPGATAELRKFFYKTIVIDADKLQQSLSPKRLLLVSNDSFKSFYIEDIEND